MKIKRKLVPLQQVGLFVLYALFLLSACKNNSPVFEQKKSLNAEVWNRFESVSFVYQQPDVLSGEYRLKMVVNHSKTIRPNELFFDLIITKPEGEERIKTCHFWLKDNQSVLKGEYTEEGVVTTQTIYAPLELNQVGEWKFEIDPRFTLYEIEGVTAISLIVEPIQKEQ